MQRRAFIKTSAFIINAAIACVLAGLLHALVQPEKDGNYNVRIGGQAVTVMKGEFYL